MFNCAKYLFIVFAFFLIACSTQYDWINLTQPNANYASDRYECANLANRTASAFDSADYIPPPAINEGARPNLACNSPNLSPVNCFSSTPQSAIPVSDSQLLRQTTYQRFIEQCLNKKGWQKNGLSN
jgi:hypothetical protein